jgi:hypothetical protein
MMEQTSINESNLPPDGLTEVYRLLSVKEPGYIKAEDLLNKGFSEDQTAMILNIVSSHSSTVEQLNFYASEANKQVIEQNIKLTLERNKALEKSGQDTMVLVDKLKRSLIENATGTLTAFNRVIIIYTIAFAIGVLLIITAIIFGAMGKTILAVSFGAIGLIDIVTYFVKLPADKIQESRSNLSQLQVVLLVWMKELINNDALCAKILNVENPSIAAYKELSEISINNTSSLLKLIEDMAEPKN